MSDEALIWLIRIAGVGHFAVAAASMGAPKVLKWREELARLSPLNRQIFSTYAGYVLTINLLFGVLAVAAPHWLTDHSPLAAAVCGFIFAYWAVRLVLQFVYYDGAQKPPGLRFKIAEVVFVLHFAYFTAVFGYAAVRNLQGLA
jgi:hypothetical protein